MPAGNYKQVFATKKKGLDRALNVGLQNTAYEAISRMIDLTPVDTGAAKGHWFASGSPDGDFDKTHTDPDGATTKARAKADLQPVRVGDLVYLTNTAPYFFYLEHGSSQQAPAGVVTITLAEMGVLFRRNLKASFGQEL